MLGFGWAVVVWVGVVAVDVDVLVVVVWVLVLTTLGGFALPGTVSVGVVGSGWEALSLPPPQAAMNGTSPVSATTPSIRDLTG